MPKALAPRECLKKLIESKVKSNKEKWEAGYPNQYFEWEELQTDILNQDELLRNYIKDCSELRMYNEKLVPENERLRNENSNLKAELEKLKAEKASLEKEYNYLMGNPEDDEDGWQF